MWLPYVAATGLQERFGVQGPLGPALMLLSLILALPVGWALQTDFGLKVTKRACGILIVALAVALGVRWLTGLTAVSAGWANPAQFGPNIVAGTFAVAAVPSLAEDILTRGFPLFAHRRKVLVPWLIVGSAALYTLNHVWRFDWGATEQVRLFAMGLAYAAAAWRTGSLWAAFALHLGWNVGGTFFAVEIVDPEAFRLLSAAVHLMIAALVLSVPRGAPSVAHG